MAEQRLRYNDATGVFSIMPTPAIENARDVDIQESVDLQETKRAVRSLIEDDVNAIMLNGTLGEGATLTESEWKTFTREVTEAADGDVPVIAGPTTLNTKDTIRRAKFARDVGADGILLGRPMWCELSDRGTVDYYADVANEVPELGIVVYYNPTAFKNTFSVSLWEELAEIPQVVAAKYISIEGEDELFYDIFDAVKGDLRLLPIEFDWFDAYQQLPDAARACWSASASCDPQPVTKTRDLIFESDSDGARSLCQRMAEASDPLIPEGDISIFRKFNIPLQKARMNAAGYLEAGPPRPPYTHLPDDYERSAREAGNRWSKLADEINQ